MSDNNEENVNTNINVVSNEKTSSEVVINENTNIELTEKDVDNSNVINEDESVNDIETNVKSEVILEKNDNDNTDIKNVVSNKKLDKKSILLILFFIFLFVFIFEIPRVNDWLDKIKHSGMNEFQQQARNIEKQNEKAKEEARKQEEEAKKNEVEVLNTVKCTLITDVYSSEYTTTMTNELLVNGNDEVISNNLILQYDYHDTSNSYISNKNECDNLDLKMKNIDGFSYMCTINDSQLKFVYKFELSKVKEVKYIRADGTSGSVAASVKLKQNLTDAKNELIAKGFICE